MDSGSGKADKSSAEWVMHKGRKIQSRMKKVSKIVASKLDNGPEETKKDTYQPPSMELLQTKESALHEAMSLNEQLAKATKTKRDIQKQIRALNHKLDTTNAWIAGIRDNPKFLDVQAIGKLYEEIRSLKNYMKVVEAGGVVEGDHDRASIGSTATLRSTSGYFDDFSPAEVLCSVCSEATAAVRALWCHRCGYYVCEGCIDAARQCPKCLEGSIEDYSLGGEGGGEDDGGPAPADEGRRGGGRRGKFKEKSFRTVSAKEREGDYLFVAHGAGHLQEEEEENIYETID